MPMGRDDTDISALHKLDDVYRALPVLLADMRAFSASLDAHRQQSLERYDALANKVDALEAAHAAALRVLPSPAMMRLLRVNQVALAGLTLLVFWLTDLFVERPTNAYQLGLGVAVVMAFGVMAWRYIARGEVPQK